MVRKVIIALLLLVCLLAVPMAASAAEIYDGNISSSYTTIFKDIVSSEVGLFDDYVFYRSGQYEYSVAVGDLTFENGVFSGEEVHLYSINNDSSSYNSSYEYSVSSVSSFSLTVSNQLIYSNLGNYPNLIERSCYYEVATVFMLCIALCLYLLRGIFGFSLRLYR